MRREYTEIGRKELDSLAVWLFQNREDRSMTDVEAVNRWASLHNVKISCAYDAVKLLDQTVSHRNLPEKDYRKALEMDGLIRPSDTRKEVEA